MGYEAIPTGDTEEALRLIRSGRCRLILVSIQLEGPEPYDFLERTLRCDPSAHVIIMTTQYTLEAALEAIRRGAADFLPKPVDHTRLKRTLDDVAALYDQRWRVRALEEQLLKDLEFHGIIGQRKFSASAAPVSIAI
jgi:DNA-binding NtrC family response regulator